MDSSVKNFGDICWAGHYITGEAANSHFCFVGTTGSGKTLSIRALMGSVLPGYVGREKDHRALIYDAKKDMYAILSGMGLEKKICILNPFDRRCYAWNIAADITTPAAALELASILIPERDEKNPFFSDAARDLLSGVVEALNYVSPGGWNFRDVLCPLLDIEDLQNLLRRSPYTQDRLIYFKNEKTSFEILATLKTKIAPYKIIAANWMHAIRENRLVSLKDWVQNRSGYILILGSNESLRKAIDAINQVLFKRIVELVLDQRESAPNERRTWFFLDELRQMGRLDGLQSLLTNGRSKGACVVLALQDINGLRDVYGEHVTEEILGQCNSKALLRLTSPSTAKWASELFDKVRVGEQTYSVTNEGIDARLRHTAELNSRGAPGTTVTSNLTERDAVMPGKFLDLPITNEKNGLKGYYISSFTRDFGGEKKLHYGARLIRPETLSKFLGRVGNPAENFRPWDGDSSENLEPWGDSERLHFGLKPKKPIITNDESDQKRQGQKAKTAPPPGKGQKRSGKDILEEEEEKVT